MYLFKSDTMMHVCTVLILLMASIPVAFQSVRGLAARPPWDDSSHGPGLPQVERLEVIVPPPTRAVRSETPNFLRSVTPVLLD